MIRPTHERTVAVLRKRAIRRVHSPSHSSHLHHHYFAFLITIITAAVTTATTTTTTTTITDAAAAIPRIISATGTTSGTVAVIAGVAVAAVRGGRAKPLGTRRRCVTAARTEVVAAEGDFVLRTFFLADGQERQRWRSIRDYGRRLQTERR